MEAFFDHNTFKGDCDGTIRSRMNCEFSLPDGWSANVTVNVNGYEHRDRGDHDIPPSTSGTYWVDTELATFYNADGEKAIELRYEKELTIKITY